MHLIRHVSWNWFSQLYVAFAGILVVPIYMHYMGTEAYGLVAFMLTIQAFMSLLDLGFSASLSRETSRYHSGASDSLFFYSFASILNRLFINSGLFIVIMITVLSGYLGGHWLQLETLTPAYVSYLLKVVAVIVFLRWLSVYYRSIVFGFNDIVWLAKFTIFITTLRYLGIIPLFIFADADVEFYLWFQLMVQLLEMLFLAQRRNKWLPVIKQQALLKWTDQAFRTPLRFAAAAGAATILWVMVSQVDRLIGSTMLTLSDYGFFHIAVMAAGVILIMTGPVVQTLQPRVTTLIAAGQEQDALILVRKLFDFMVCLAAATTFSVYFFGFSVLNVWQGDAEFALKITDTFIIYCAGNAILAINSCSYILDYATGRVRLRVLASFMMLVLLTVLLPLGFNYSGGQGAAWVWLAVNLVYLFFFQPFLLAQYQGKLYRKLLLSFIQLFAICIILGLFAEFCNLHQFLAELTNPLLVLLFGGSFWLASLIAFCMTKAFQRDFILAKLSGFYERT